MKALSIAIVLCLWSSATAFSQGFGRSGLEEQTYALDTLVRKSEYWLGANVTSFYAMNFGTLTTDIIGGTAPGSPAYTVEMQGGSGYGMGLGPSFEYRPLFGEWGYFLYSSFEYRWIQAESTTPVAMDIFAQNATFEQRTAAVYVSGALGGKYQVGVTGVFLMAATTFALPLQVVESYVWQHEKSTGGEPSNTPGGPNTSIRFNSSPTLVPRFGLQIGIGHDLMVGWFGYRNQMITPYIVLESGTPIVSSPTAWNNAQVRIGATWRTGL